MIRKLLATTAIATLVATGAVAQTTTGETTAQTEQNQQQEMSIRAEGHLASNLMGEAVYNGSGDEAENIGDVTDLVIDDNGEIQAIVVGVGGFLGIGQKEVSLEYDVMQWQEQQDGERRIVVETTSDALQQLPEFDRTAYRPMPSDADVAETTPASQDELASAPQSDGQQQTEQQANVSPLEGDDEGDTTVTVTEDEQQTQDTAATTESDQESETQQDVAVEQDTDSADQTQDMAAEQDTDVQDTEQTAQTDDQQESDEAEVTVTTTEDEQTDTQQTAQTDSSDQQPADESQDMAAEQETDVQDTEQTAQTDDQAQDQGTDQTQTAAVDQSSLQEAQPNQVRAENLTGTSVYGANEEEIGQIGDVILTPEGEVDAVIVDVGGFLGIGQKEVALSIDNLAFMSDQDDNLYLYTQFTQEDLEAQPEYDQATYAEQRDEMLLEDQ